MAAATPPVSKREAMYRDQVDECSVCKHFRAPKACEVVAGDVDPCGWCRFFARKGSKSLAGGKP